MARLLRSGQAGTGIPVCTLRVPELDLASASALAFLVVLAGAGTIGDPIGTITASFSTTTATCPPAEFSLIAITSTLAEACSIMGFMGEDFTVGRQSMDSRRPTARLACTPALSVASIMEASREGFRLPGKRALGADFRAEAAFMAEAALMVEAAFMAAEVTGNFSRC